MSVKCNEVMPFSFGGKSFHTVGADEEKLR